MNTVSQSEPTNVVYGLYCVCPECASTPERIRYVGKTIRSARARLYKHKSECRLGAHRPLYDWMRKHGLSNIEYHILDIVDTSDDLYIREQFWIDKMSTRVSRGFGGLNLTDGGAGTRGYKYSEETLVKMRGSNSPNATCDEAMVTDIKRMLWDGVPVSLVAKEFDKPRHFVTDINIGRKWAAVPWPVGPRRMPRTRELMSKNATGRRHSEESKRLMSEGKMGHTHSDETRKLISLKGAGRKASDETRKLMSKSSAAMWSKRRAEGWKPSDETSRLMSEGMKESWRRRKAVSEPAR